MKKTWQIVSVVVAVIALAFTIWQTFLTRKSLKHELGGNLSALVGDHKVSTGTVSDVVIFTTGETLSLSGIDIVPIFVNNTKYTVHDVFAEYVVSGDVMLTPSDGYSSSSQDGRTTVSCPIDKVGAHLNTKQPFVSLSVEGNESQGKIESSVTYDGAMMPMQFTTNLSVLKVAKQNGQTVEQWKQQCRTIALQQLEGRTANIYYCNSECVSKELDVLLTKQNDSTPEQTKPKTEKQPKKKQQKVKKEHPEETLKVMAAKEPKTIAEEFVVTKPRKEKVGLLLRSEYDPETSDLTVYYKPVSYSRNIVVWYSCHLKGEKWSDPSIEFNNCFYYSKCNPGDSVCVIHIYHLKGVSVKESHACDVMEEDASLLANIEINGRKVRNRTGQTIVCYVETEDGSTLKALSGKWYRYKREKFDSEVICAQAFPVADDKAREVTDGLDGNWALILVLPFILIAPFIALFYVFKNKFNLRKAVRDWANRSGVVRDSNFGLWFWIIFTLVLIAVSIFLIVWNVVMATPPSV